MCAGRRSLISACTGPATSSPSSCAPSTTSGRGPAHRSSSCSTSCPACLSRPGCSPRRARRDRRTMDNLLDTLGPGKVSTTFVSGEGALLWDEQGHTTWDFYGGHAVTLIGQGHPKWVAALTEQARQLSFVTTLCDVPVRRRAAERLCTFTGMDRVFFVNSGAEANEAALKVSRKATGRSVIVAMEGGFHGRTMGAAGVSHHHRAQHGPPHGEVRFVPFGDLAAL